MGGAELKNEKMIFWEKSWEKIEYKGQNLTKFKKKQKKGIFMPKKQAGAELKKKKRIFGPKIGKKFENKVQKLSNFKEKKDFSGQKNKIGLSLRRKRIFLGQKLGEKLGMRGKNFPIVQKKKRTFRAKK